MLRKFAGILCLWALSLSAAFADVSGNWNFAVEIAGVGGGNASVTMQQAADGVITGTYAGQLGNTNITGKAEGNAFEFIVAGQMGSVKYMGELQADGTLKGTLDLGGMGEGTFTATRRE
jgi:hypothetical protein